MGDINGDVEVFAMDEIAARVETFRKSDADRDALMAELVRRYHELHQRYSDTKDDYNNEIASRRMWQNRATTSETALKQASLSANFAIGLIDGDGALFQDFLISRGKDGGAEAAHLLHREMTTHLKAIYPESNVSDWNIVVHVVLNLQGLSTKLLSCGTIANPNEMVAFGRAFGLAQPLFSFIDVGGGKERADHKIREFLRLYMPIGQCKHVFLGPCHDNGYLPVLEPYRRDAAVAARLTLIETRLAEPGFVELGLGRIRMPSVFRSTDLPSSRVAINSPTAAKVIPVVYTQPAIVKQSTSPSPPVDSVQSQSAGNTWAAVGKSGNTKAGTTNKTINIAPKPKAPARPCGYLNMHDERIDLELPRADPAAESRYMERIKKSGKCCNAFYLSGKCDAGVYCDYQHGEKLTPGEILVLKHKARSRSCVNTSYCRSVDCTHGHHCKFGKDCHAEYCYFRDTHDVDPTPAKRFFEDGSEEWLQSFLDQHHR